MSELVGILGGMGPHATVAFQQHILDRTKTVHDNEHIRFILDMQTKIPSRTRALLFNETSPLEGMVESCEKLAAYGVDFIVLPCNSACHWMEPLRERVAVEIVSIVEVTAAEIHRRGYKKVCPWGGYVTYTQALYQKALQPYGVEVKPLPESSQRKLEELILEVKRTFDTFDWEKFNPLRECYPDDVVPVYACTELTGFSTTGIDSSLVLADYVINRVGGVLWP